MPKGDGETFLPAFMRQRSKVSSFFQEYMNIIDLFVLLILFSQYGSFDDTQESVFCQSWTFSCLYAVFLMSLAEVQTS